MFRAHRRLFLPRFHSTPSRQALQQCFVFPTSFPIFPHYIYVTRISKHLYTYLRRNSITYAIAAALQPGVAKQAYLPDSYDQMVEEWLRKQEREERVRREALTYGFEIKNNNVVFDEPILRHVDAVPIHYIRSTDQVFPVASLCKMVLSDKDDMYSAHLNAEARFLLSPKPDNHGRPLVYLSGRRLVNHNITQVQKQHQKLANLHAKIEQYTKVNLPYIRNQLFQKSIQLMGGYLCTLAYFTSLQLYHLFRITNLPDRVRLMLQYYTEYVGILEIRWKYFNEQFQEKITKQQSREHVRQIYENLQRTLGHKADTEYIRKVYAKLATGRYPLHVSKILEAELKDLEEIHEANPEINRKKQYINLLVDYPFGTKTKQTFNVPEARQVLDQQHYGMKKIKQRILQFIAVGQIKKQFKSKVLLLHGPPGVGKTSIVKSIAKCLNRPYGRISLGGEYDTSIMKGHRRTYLGSYPGKIYNTILKSKAENPVILLDEIDKVQLGSGGASLQYVIMQALDPIQNTRFKDEFMDVEIDLSNVLFICTANELGTIYPPLLDRMEKIEVTGYTTSEKKEIFHRYIHQKGMEIAGLPQQIQEKLDFSQEALHALIEGYCKQAGIRNLVRKAHQIYYKTALKYVKNEQFDKTITPKTLVQYLGQPEFKQARMYPSLPPKGVIVGLAYNSYGGSILYIEAAAANIRQSKPSEPAPVGSLIVTGNLHDVMKQSCQLGYSYAKYITSTYFSNHFLETNDIHLNFPELQIGKDGPSAGVAITCTLVSLALGKPAVREIAMTGEISLSGKVGAIGGVKEKTMGAKREGIMELIFPEDNRCDVEELEQEIKEGVSFHFVQDFYQVMELVFQLKIAKEQSKN